MKIKAFVLIVLLIFSMYAIPLIAAEGIDVEAEGWQKITKSFPAFCGGSMDCGEKVCGNEPRSFEAEFPINSFDAIYDFSYECTHPYEKCLGSSLSGTCEANLYRDLRSGAPSTQPQTLIITCYRCYYGEFCHTAVEGACTVSFYKKSYGSCSNYCKSTMGEGAGGVMFEEQCNCDCLMGYEKHEKNNGATICIGKEEENQPPKCSFITEPKTIRVGDDVSLISLSEDPDGDAITRYEWYLDNVNVGSGKQLSIEMREANKHEIKLRVWDSKGAQGVCVLSLVIGGVATYDPDLYNYYFYKTEGSVKIKRSGSNEWKDADSLSGLSNQIGFGDEIITGSNGYAILRFGKWGVLHLHPRTHLIVREDPEKPGFFEMLKGELKVVGEATAMGIGGACATPVLLISHIMTSYSVLHDPETETSYVFVEEGKVRVTDLNGEGGVTVGENQITSVSEGGLPKEPTFASQIGAEDRWWEYEEEEKKWFEEEEKGNSLLWGLVAVIVIALIIYVIRKKGQKNIKGRKK